MLERLFHKHSWVFQGLRTIDRDKKDIERDERDNKKPSEHVFHWTIKWDYQKCRKCGKIRYE